MDEAPLMMISNYEVTYFLKRDVNNVFNKELVVSPPIPWNSQSPAPLAAYLYCLHHAFGLWEDGVKARLGHAQVPATPPLGVSGVRQAHTLCQKTDGARSAQRQQPARGQQGSNSNSLQQQDGPGLEQPKQLHEIGVLDSFCLNRGVQLSPSEVGGDLNRSSTEDGSESPGSEYGHGSYSSGVCGSISSSHSSSQVEAQELGPPALAVLGAGRGLGGSEGAGCAPELMLGLH